MSTEGFPQSEFTPEAGSTHLVLVRHGQSAPYVPGQPFSLVDGQGDPPLSERGQWQAQQVAARLQSESVDAIYATSLQRTVQTATPLAEAIGLSITVEPDLREVHLGIGEGGLFRQMAAEGHPQVLEMRRRGEWGAIEGAETNAQLAARCGAAINRVAANHPDQLVVVVCHGGVIASLMGVATGAPPFTFRGVRNGSLTHLIRSPDGWTVRSFNDGAHVGPLLADADPPT